MNQISIWFGQLLKLFYDMSNNYALSIILFTIVTKFILLPLTFSQMRSMNAMKTIQPKVDEINKKYKGNPQKQSEKLSQLYKENRVNPAAGCLPLLIQFPILIAMYRVVREPIKYVFLNETAYNLVDKGFFWIKSLEVPDVIAIQGINLPYILPVLSALFTYVQMQMSMSRSSSSSSNATAEGMNKTMTYMMPLMMLVWGVNLPAGLILYWATGTLVQILQQYLIGKYEYHMNFRDDDKSNKRDSQASIKKKNNR